jgi:hypothetical protein
MNRDFDKFKKSLEDHHRWQLDYFTIIKSKLIEKAKEWKKKGEMDKHDYIMKEASEMRFQFDKSEASINYGDCSKLNKPVSFIPNVCQPDTQHCFIHRKS